MGEEQQPEEGEIEEEKEQHESELCMAVDENTGNLDCNQWPVFRFDIPPRRMYHFRYQFMDSAHPNNFLRGAKWSPDGSCFLTCLDDNTFRLFDLPENVYTDLMECEATLDGQDSYASSIIVNEAETVYDYCWYPYMSASDPATCVFASSTRDHPIHLWDAVSGQLRCSYRAYDSMDEITAALSISFNSLGTKLFAGYNKSMRVFDVHRPGRDFKEYSLAKGNDCPSGIVSSIAFSPTDNGLLAIGSYSQTTAVYAEDNMELLYVLHGQVGGVTQVLFSKDGNYIYTGGRKDPYILCWDIRNTAGIIYKLYRSSENTNQRISFDIEPAGRHLGTGGQDGLIHIYDLQSGQWTAGFQAASDTTSGFSFHPCLPLAVSSSGHRRFGVPENFEENLNLAGDGAYEIQFVKVLWLLHYSLNFEVSPGPQGDENCASVWSFSSRAADPETGDDGSENPEHSTKI